MKFSIGDPVYIKSNDEEGIIEEFVGADMVKVIVHGKNYLVFSDDLEHPYLRWFLHSKTKQKTGKTHIDQIRNEQRISPELELPEGIYLAFMPQYSLDQFEDRVEKVRVYVFNQTPREYTFWYQIRVQNKLLFSIEADILVGQSFYVHDLSFEDMASNPTFYYRFVDKLDLAYDNEGSLIVKPKKLFDQINEIQYSNKPFFYYKLFESLHLRKKEEVVVNKSRILTDSGHSERNYFNFAQANKEFTYEIDLHIEKLIASHHHLSNQEILEIQLKECQKALDLAIATHQQSVVLIHGIGKGVLKTRINDLLNQTKGVKKYVNEFDVRYGYGATKVFFDV